VDKEWLHQEVLSQQQVLDFESYKYIMALITTYSRRLTDTKDDATFQERISLL
jgi:hypothetical protein